MILIIKKIKRNKKLIENLPFLVLLILIFFSAFFHISKGRSLNMIFEEVRQWQVAVDSNGAKLILLWDSADGTVPDGWTCISCSADPEDDFYQRFIRGSSSYGTSAGGSATHTHPDPGTLTSGGASGSATGGSTGGKPVPKPPVFAHTHTASITSGLEGTNIPAYRNLKVIRCDAGIPDSLPANVIAIFDDTPPSGWSTSTYNDGRYARGENTTGTGGSNTHTHTIALGQTSAGANASDVAGTGTSVGGISHYHASGAQNTTAEHNHEPPYRTVILAKKDSSGSIPDGMIGMLDNSPPSGWENLSSSGQPFFERFFKPTGTYGSTGDSSSHTHSNLTVTTGGPSAADTSATTGSTYSAPDHTHNFTVTFGSAVSHLPPYWDVIFAKSTPLPTIDISGSIYQEDESTLNDISFTIALSVNNGTPVTTTATSSYSFTGVSVNSNDSIAVYIQGHATYTANTFTVTDSSTNITNLHLYRGKVAVGNNNSSTTLNSDICNQATYPSGGDRLISCTTDNITVNSGVEFHILAAKAYGTGSGNTLTTQGSGGDLHLDDGSQATISGNSTVGDSVVVEGGATLQGASNLTVKGGDIVCGTSCGTINFTSGTTTLESTGSFGSSGLSPSWTFYNLTFGDGTASATTTSQGTGTSTISNVLTIASNHTLNAGSQTWVLTGSGTPFVKTGTFTASSSTFKYTSSGGNYDTEANTVATSSLITSLPNRTFMRKTFYANGRFWVFYSNGTDGVYNTSTNGTDWTSATVFRAGAQDGITFAITFDGTYVHYVYTEPPALSYDMVNNPVYYRRGTPGSDGTITWSAVEQTASPGVATYKQHRPNIAVDSAGYPWVTWQRGGQTSGNYEPFVSKSSTNDGTWSTQSGFPYFYDLIYNCYLSLVPLTNQKMYWFIGGGYYLKGARWDGSGWSSVETIDGDGVTSGWVSHSGVNEGDDIHVVYRNASNNIVYKKRTYDTGWDASATTVQATTGGGGPSLSIDKTTNNLYCFWMGDPTANHIYYKKRISGTWDTNPTDWIDESSEGLTHNGQQTSFYQDYSDHIGFIYMTKTSSPYNIKFAGLNFRGSAPTYITAATYNNLELSPSANAVTFTLGTAASQTITTNGYLTIGNGTNTGTITAATYNPTLNVDGNLTISANATFTASGSGSFTLAGNWTNNGTFTHSNGTATLDGTSQQTLSGTMTGTSSFYNLTITNNSGTDPDTSPSVIFSAAATANTSTITTGSVKLRFLAAANYTFTNINWNGQATGTRIAFRSSSSPTQWNLIVTGTQSVSYVNPKDSNACGGSNINATDGTSLDGGNNNCWDFPLTFTQNDYRWYVNTDSVDVTDPWPEGATDLAENTPITSTDSPPGLGDILRIRMNLTVGGSALSANNQAFKLQYGQDTDCTAISSWTDVDGISGSGIWRGYNNPTPADGTAIDEINFGNEYVFNTAITYHVSSAALSETKFVVSYQDKGNLDHGTSIIGTVSGSTISFGSEYVFNSATTSYILSVALSDTKFVVSYQDGGNSGYGTSIIGTVSGSTISFGSEYVFNTASTSYISSAALSSTKFVVSYRDLANSQYGTSIIGTVSNSTISFGSAVVFNAETYTDYAFNSSAALSDTKFVISYQNPGNSQYGTSIIGTVSDSTISFGSAYVFNSDGTWSLSNAALSSTKFVVSYRDAGNSNYGTSVIGTVSDSTISFGSEYVFNSATTTYTSHAVFSETKFVVSYRDGTGYGTSIIGTVSDSTISFGPAVVFNAGATWYCSAVVLSDTKFAISYRDGGNSDHGTSIIGAFGTKLSTSTTRGTYEEENPSANNPYAASVNNNIEWDWVVQHNGAVGGTTYCFRMVKSDGTSLDTYNSDGYPKLITATEVSITVSGTVYQADESTVLTTQPAMKLAVGASTSYGTTANIDGTFSFSAVVAPSDGSVLTIWLDTNAGTEKASLVLKYGSSCAGYPDCTGLPLYQNRVNINNKHTGSIANSDLTACDNDSGSVCSDTDIGFTSNGGVLTLTFSTNMLRITSGITFAPGGTVTCQKLRVAGTYSGGSETLTLEGSGTGSTCGLADQMPLCVDGTFSASSNTVKFIGTSASNIALNSNFYYLDLSPAATVTYTLGTGAAQTLTVGGNLDVGDGTNALTLTAATNNPDISVTGATTIKANAVLTIGSGTQTFSGNLTTNGTLNGSGNLTVNGSATGGGTINLSGGAFLQRVGSDQNFGANSGSNNWTFNNLTFENSSASANRTITTSATGTGQIIISGTLTIGNAGDTYNIILNNNTNNRIIDANGDVTITSKGVFQASGSASFTVAGNWTNSGTFTHSNGTVTFDATSGDKTITDGGSCFYTIVFNGGASWTYQDSGCSAGPNQTTVQAGTVLYLNTKTGTVSVTGGTLNVDWYLGTHVVDAANTSTNIDTADADITISENSATPASTVWRHDGATWGSGATFQTTGTGADGKNPQPNSAGAIRIREYSQTSTGPTYYLYNLHIEWQETYGEYDYYADYGNKYLTSTLNTASGHDEVIGANWYRESRGTMNGSPPYSGLNEAPAQGSWYCGMLKGLEVIITGTSINFGTLDLTNDFTGTAAVTTDISVTTSATSGYIVTAWETQLMACSDSGACASETIQNFTYGTYANPQPWITLCKDNSNYCGFGFTSSDPEVEGVNRYNNGTEYTYFPTNSASPVRVMDYPGPISSQSYSITYRISAPLIQRPGPYATTIIYVVTAQY